MMHHVLLIDDDDLIVRSVRSLLRDRAIEVTTTRHAFDLPTTLVSNRPDLILVDGSVPGIEAEAVVRAARAVEGPVRVVLFSGRSESELEEKARAVGADGYLPKQSPPKDFVAGVMSFLAPTRPTMRSPAAMPEPHGETTTLAPPPDTAESKPELRILLIDDSEIALAVHEHYLRQAGFDVRATLSVGEFDVLLRGWQPHLVLMDVQMPEIGGEILCRRVKAKLGMKVPVVLLSDLPREELEQRARLGDADAFLSKNDDPKMLIEYVRSICALVYSPEALP